MVANDQLALSDFVAFFLYVNIFMKPVFRLLMFTEMYQRGMAGYHRFNEMMQHKVEIDDALMRLLQVILRDALPLRM